jgi:fumarylacetoacetate (FAA) hydrolase
MRLVTFRVAEADGSALRVGILEAEGVAELAAPSMPAWLSGEGRERSGARHALTDVVLLAPVPEPPSVRDFFAFEGHVAAGWRLRGGDVPAAWYDAPAFYFSNPASIVGPAQAVARPAATRALDFELEIAAVLDADGGIAGFTLLNDLSARDIQRAEMTVGLGPAKGKDFATALGPWLVTPDELPYEDGRLQLEAVASVNGDEVARSSAAEQHFSWPEIVAHAGRDTRLRAGDVLGSGTLTGGCLLERNADHPEPRWLEPGDVVELAAPGLGILPTPIV